jgi:hypothetical protein
MVGGAGTEARIKRKNKRILLLFTDVLLVAEPPLLAPGKKATGKEKLVVKQVRHPLRLIRFGIIINTMKSPINP